jgi:leucyl/phenylalanyl-tRNA---protein transferase
VIFKLEKNRLLFPSPELAEEDGLLAVGGDLSVARLKLAYSMGIFPWYSEETPILWYSPHKRFVIFPEKLKVSKTMRKVLRSNVFSLTENMAFEAVIDCCAAMKREGQEGTWILPEMREAYVSLHQDGCAHSIEVWQGDELVGGLYGVLSGTAFCGESMFSKVSNASKVALIYLCRTRNYSMIDCQLHTPHLESMGGEFISRELYMKYLRPQLSD